MKGICVLLLAWDAGEEEKFCREGIRQSNVDGGCRRRRRHEGERGSIGLVRNFWRRAREFFFREGSARELLGEMRTCIRFLILKRYFYVMAMVGKFSIDLCCKKNCLHSTVMFLSLWIKRTDLSNYCGVPFSLFSREPIKYILYINRLTSYWQLHVPKNPKIILTTSYQQLWAQEFTTGRNYNYLMYTSCKQLSVILMM